MQLRQKLKTQLILIENHTKNAEAIAKHAAQMINAIKIIKNSQTVKLRKLKPLINVS